MIVPGVATNVVVYVAVAIVRVADTQPNTLFDWAKNDLSTEIVPALRTKESNVLEFERNGVTDVDVPYQSI